MHDAEALTAEHELNVWRQGHLVGAFFAEEALNASVSYESAPAVARERAERHRNYFRAGPERDAFDLGVEDGIASEIHFAQDLERWQRSLDVISDEML